MSGYCALQLSSDRFACFDRSPNHAYNTVEGAGTEIIWDPQLLAVRVHMGLARHANSTSASFACCSDHDFHCDPLAHPGISWAVCAIKICNSLQFLPALYVRPSSGKLCRSIQSYQVPTIQSIFWHLVRYGSTVKPIICSNNYLFNLSLKTNYYS